MRASISKWGNSLAVRLPRGIAGTLDLAEGAAVDLTVEEGRIVITPARPSLRLSDMLARFELHHRHDADDGGPDVGAERF